MQRHDSYFIEGKALFVHPFNAVGYVGGTVLRSGCLGSIVEVMRFELSSFTVSVKDLAESGWS